MSWSSKWNFSQNSPGRWFYTSSTHFEVCHTWSCVQESTPGVHVCHLICITTRRYLRQSSNNGRNFFCTRFDLIYHCRNNFLVRRQQGVSQRIKISFVQFVYKTCNYVKRTSSPFLYIRLLHQNAFTNSHTNVFGKLLCCMARVHLQVSSRAKLKNIGKWKFVWKQLHILFQQP